MLKNCIMEKSDFTYFVTNIELFIILALLNYVDMNFIFITPSPIYEGWGILWF